MSMIEEEQQPEIIKYCEENFTPNLPKLLNKKTSGGSVDLQAMTLIEDDKEQEVFDLVEHSEGKGGPNYAELKD